MQASECCLVIETTSVVAELSVYPRYIYNFSASGILTLGQHASQSYWFGTNEQILGQ
jgi:hypothetical protein